MPPFDDHVCATLFAMVVFPAPGIPNTTKIRGSAPFLPGTGLSSSGMSNNTLPHRYSHLTNFFKKDRETICPPPVIVLPELTYDVHTAYVRGKKATNTPPTWTGNIDPTMTMMKLAIFAVLACVVASFAPVSQTTRQSSRLHETFGLGLGEDTYANQPVLLRGEQEYKQFINKYKEDNMINRKVRMKNSTFSSPCWICRYSLDFYSTVQCYRSRP